MDVIASPSTRKLAQELGLDIEELAIRLGRKTISQDDLKQKKVVVTQEVTNDAVKYWDVDHSKWGKIKTEALNKTASVALKNLMAANQIIPSVTHHDSGKIDRIEKLRKNLKKENKKITQLAFHILVLAKCLSSFPRFNSSLSTDFKHLILKDYINIGIAVDTPFGLVVPVIRNANLLNLSEVSQKLVDYADRAQRKRLRPNDLGGASMTVSSLGGIGGKSFTPIVNPPEVAILGISKMDIRPVWDGEKFIPSAQVPLDLTYDHRVINGAEAARFLKYYTTLLEKPEELVLDTVT
ncbi:2-oxo acid dehydrogenase subunit E2 [Paracoccaceae bacterium]|nr:2-oxo acid dehydrogenase subunit E2 [Paracoccaceae bacterium]